MAAVGDVGQFEKTFEEFSDDSVRRLHSLLLQEVKPDGIDIEDGIFRKLKRIQIISLDSPSALLLMLPTFGALPPGRRSGQRRPVPGPGRSFHQARGVLRRSGSLQRPGFSKARRITSSTLAKAPVAKRLCTKASRSGGTVNCMLGSPSLSTVPNSELFAQRQIG
jgi:hypothetical protein